MEGYVFISILQLVLPAMLIFHNISDFFSQKLSMSLPYHSAIKICYNRLIYIYIFLNGMFTTQWSRPETFWNATIITDDNIYFSQCLYIYNTCTLYQRDILEMLLPILSALICTSCDTWRPLLLDSMFYRHGGTIFLSNGFFIFF